MGLGVALHDRWPRAARGQKRQQIEIGDQDSGHFCRQRLHELDVLATVVGFEAISFSADGSGRYLGVTISGTRANFTLSNATLEYQETNVGNK